MSFPNELAPIVAFLLTVKLLRISIVLCRFCGEIVDPKLVLLNFITVLNSLLSPNIVVAANLEVSNYSSLSLAITKTWFADGVAASK